MRCRAAASPVVHLLVFEMAGRKLALLASAVREVVRAVAIAPLPKAPAIVEGVINFHDTLVPVLDLRRRFGLPSIPVTPQQYFILAQAGPRVVALRVDQAVDVVTVPETSVEEANGLVPGLEYVAGIARAPDGLLIIHDLGTFLSLDEARELAGAVEAARA
jgi:purine-binding chemotaxis protein CheW